MKMHAETINQVKEKKKQLSIQIKDLITQFNEETDVRVIGIELVQVCSNIIGDQNKIASVKIKIDL